MKLKIKVIDIQTVNELDFYWETADYINLLNEFNFPDAENSPESELKELLFMAMGDFDPDESARILLSYKLGEELNEGQIQSISHEMLNDKVAEEYPEPALHYDLFNINQLLYKGYNGKFPNTEASILKVEITKLSHHDEMEVNKEVVLKSLKDGLKDSNLIKRLFEEQLTGKEPFTDAAKSLWKVDKLEGDEFRIITSAYWLDKEDFDQVEFEVEIAFFEE